MKRHRTFFASLAAGLLAALTVAASSTGLAARPSAHPQPAAAEGRAPRKRALLVGISNYKRKGADDEWWNLNTELDLELLTKVLVEKFKFAPGDIVTLRDAQATKHAILGEWRKLVAQTAKGDVVFVHFSGHGDSIPDDNGDEIDGKDESLVPFDYASKKNPANNIRDDEIGKLLGDLKQREPGNVTVSIDSCYSGTATRGDYVTRGGGGGDAKPEGESPSGLREKSASYSKDYVFLAASNPRQLAKEIDYDKRRMGVYTFALVKALSEATPRTTYRDLFERVNDIITTKRGDQNPQFEGSPDELVFDGTAVRQERYVSVVRPVGTKASAEKAVLQTGRLLGATPKSRYAIYAAGTKDPQEKDALKLAEGEIIEVDATASVLKLDRPVAADKLSAARAFETQHFYEDAPLRVVLLRDVRRVRGGEAVASAFVHGQARGGTGLGVAEFSEAGPDEGLNGEAYDVKVYPAGEREVRDKVVPAGFKGLVMERKDGSILATVSEERDLTAEIRDALERESRFRVIKGLKDNEDPRLKIDLRIVPVEVKFDTKGNILSTTPKPDLARNAGGMPVFKLGDHFMLEVENQGDLDVYVTILNLRSDGTVAPGFPQTKPWLPPADNLIPRGKTVRIPPPYVFVITEPLGEESFRAIATIAPTDFSPLLDEQFIGRARGGDGAISKMLAEVGRGRTRGGENQTAHSPLARILLASSVGTRSALAGAPPPSWATSSFTFIVKGK